MNRNRVFLLSLITLAALVLVVVVSSRRPDVEGPSSAPLLPALEQSVNAIDAIDIIAPGGELAVTLRRDDERWRVMQKDGFEADFAQVVETLRTLTEAHTVAPRTSSPDLYPHLGVQELASADATGRRIDFPGSRVQSVIIGQIDPTGLGSYARRAGEDQSWLLDRVIEVPVDPVAWLERSIMDIPADDIAEVVIRHADGETVRIRRAGEEDPDFVLLNVPEGRQAGAPRLRKAVANGLRGLNLEDVRRHQPPVPEQATRVLFTTTDGLNFVADVFEREASYWVHFSVSAENPAAAAGGESEPADQESPTLEDESEGGVEESAERLVGAVAVDARLSPWEFEITERRYNDLTRRKEELLEPPPEPE